MTQKEKKDLVIIGAGPAGLTAAIYASRSLLDYVVLEQETPGGQVILPATIENYPGSPQVNGFDLGDSMRAQAVALGAEIRQEKVDSVSKNDNNVFSVVTNASSYEAKAVIFATGSSPRLAGFDGELEFRGHGVSYCATCDGMFYRGKHVFIIGGGNSAAEEALFLSRLAKDVTVVVRGPQMRAAAGAVTELENRPNVTVLYNTKVAKVSGGTLPDTITLVTSPQNGSQSLVEKTLEYEEGEFGVFVSVGRVPAAQILDGLVECDEGGHIKTDGDMATMSEGLYAAGDVRAKSVRQIVTAVSDGAVAALSAEKYLKANRV